MVFAMPILTKERIVLNRVASFKIRLKITQTCSLERRQRYMTLPENESNIVADTGED